MSSGDTVWKRKANGSVVWGGAIVDLNGDTPGGKMVMDYLVLANPLVGSTLISGPLASQIN